jgi:hypothetical protein
MLTGWNTVTGACISTSGKKLTAVAKGVPLLIIDADANLEINRLLYGNNLVGVDIRAPRQGLVTQVYSTALSKSYLAPELTFKDNAKDFQLSRGRKLRERIQGWLTKKSENGKKVLAITNKPMRLLFTGEKPGKVPLSCEAHGVTWTHYGAILGVDKWRDYDVVVLIGREQISDSAAMEQARAIACDRPEPLDLEAKFSKKVRGHRLRDGSAHGVEVWVHGEPLAQLRTEATRERGMGQGIDRLRLIHGRPGREVYVLSNILLPDLEVDRLISLDALQGGGAPLERLIIQARERWGILPLVPKFLFENFPEIATSLRTAERLIGEFKTAKVVIESCYDFSGLKTVSFSRPKQRFPSTALVFDELPPSLVTAALERLFGPVTVQFPPEAAAQDSAPAAATVDIPTPALPAQNNDDCYAALDGQADLEQPEPGALEEDFTVNRVRLPLQVTAPTASDLADNDVLDQEEPGAIEPDYEEYMTQQHQILRPPLRNTWNKNNKVANESIEILPICAIIDAGLIYKDTSGFLKHEFLGQ